MRQMIDRLKALVCELENKASNNTNIRVKEVFIATLILELKHAGITYNPSDDLKEAKRYNFSFVETEDFGIHELIEHITDLSKDFQNFFQIIDKHPSNYEVVSVKLSPGPDCTNTEVSWLCEIYWREK